MNMKMSLLLIAATALLNLSACSYVKTLFPDKEKDYQYTTEIPPLILPEDLKKSRLPSLPTATASAPAVIADVNTTSPAPVVSAPVEEPVSAVPATNESSAPVAMPETEPAVPETAIKVERIKGTDAENRLRINVPFTQAWRLVNKALSRKAIEVTERNQEAKLITVQYDPDEQKTQDGTYWDEVVFMFGGIRSNEQTYLLRLEENNQQTDLVALDKDQQLLSDAASVKLLTLLEDTIKADLAKK
jgi:outer membrane protein assembly factor BamC